MFDFEQFLLGKVKQINDRYEERKLSELEMKEIYDSFLYSEEFEAYFKEKMKEKIFDKIKEKNERYLDRVYSASEAARIWGTSSPNLRNAVNRFGRFDKWIEKGEVKKSDATWIFTERAMRDVFGEPKGDQEEKVE